MKILIVVGARPNFMKAAPLITAIREHNQRRSSAISVQGREEPETLEYCLTHTGQHYDQAMSGSFFADLHLPAPDIHLAVGSASHAVQTAEIMRRFEGVLLNEQPDAVVVVGDVNSTVACALVAAKIEIEPHGRRPLIAHVEAGLRSFDRDMPEEINRIVTDHLSDLLFVTEESGIRNLQLEGISGEKVHFVGNTMIDTLLASKERAETSTILSQLGLRKQPPTNGLANGAAPYALLTLHRPSNVDHRETFLRILDGLEALSRSLPILFSTHPRTRRRIAEFGLARFFQRQTDGDAVSGCASKGIHLLQPLGYLDFLCLMKHAAIVVTDSGGIQEETTCLGVPCVTVRENTERPVTVTAGTNILAGTDKDKICRAIAQQMSERNNFCVPEQWDGQAAARIVAILIAHVSQRNLVTQASATSQAASVDLLVAGK